MILTPAILALLVGSLLVCLTLVLATAQGWIIAERFDLRSGGPEQLALERRTYLVSTALACVMFFELASLFLFVYVAEDIHPLFVGAMCAVGSLQAEPHGYPALLVKFAAAAACAVWLILNHADSQGRDYPLLRAKYRLLPLACGLVLLGSYLQLRYFQGLSPALATSCCGSLFSERGEGVAGTLAHLPVGWTKAAFFLSLALVGRTGAVVLRHGRGAALFGGLCAWTMLLGLAAVVSFISVHYYELPSHHCPFCLLKPEYRFVGYPIYAGLLLTGVSGLGVWLLEPWRDVPSLAAALLRLRRRLCLAALAGALLLAALTLYPMLFSSFRLDP